MDPLAFTYWLSWYIRLFKTLRLGDRVKSTSPKPGERERERERVFDLDLFDVRKVQSIMNFIFDPSNCLCLCLWLSVVSLVTFGSVSCDKGPNIIVLGASTGSSSGLGNPSVTSSSPGAGGSYNLGDASGSSIISSISPSAANNIAGGGGSSGGTGGGGGPSILVLGGEGNGKKNDKKSNVIIIMQPQQAASSNTASSSHGSNGGHPPPYSSPIHPSLVLGPSAHYPIPHLMSHPALSHFSNSLVSELLLPSPSTAMASRSRFYPGHHHSSLGSLFASSPSMMEENLLKLVNLPPPLAPSLSHRSPSSIAGLKQWLAATANSASGGDSSAASNAAESLATSSSDLSDYFTPAYSF